MNIIAQLISMHGLTKSEVAACLGKSPQAVHSACKYPEPKRITVFRYLDAIEAITGHRPDVDWIDGVPTLRK